MRLTYRHQDRRLVLDVNRTGEGRFSVAIDGRPRDVQAEYISASTMQLVLDGRVRIIHLATLANACHVAIDGAVYILTPEAGGGSPPAAGALAPPQIVAPMPGKVLKVLVEPGQTVQGGDGLLILEAMKMENRIVAEAPAIVRAVHVTEGQMVDGGEVLVELEYEAPPA